MANYILGENDYIDTKGILFKDFIKLSQFLEDSGNKMYYTTEIRIEEKYFDYEYFGYSYEGVCGHRAGSKNIIPYQEILDLIENKTPQYEIY